ncbi:hypothetical protein SANT12839_041450 [Streptomyces antimycoticus]|uniref:Uncharacterized protein n=1 Tax=Streptomyces antimycoticus TaxID=68175 RepID=A0A4D4KBJ0_9ACTN|nr:hypothetical protein SANT12839_041450 [Streptomyces antimycoticus]
MRGARRGRTGTEVHDLEAEHFGVTADAQLLGTLGMQTGVGDQFGDDEQDVLRGGPVVGGRGRKPPPVAQRLAREVAGARNGPAGPDQSEPAGLADGTGGRGAGGEAEAAGPSGSGPRSPGGYGRVVLISASPHRFTDSGSRDT